MISTMSAVPSHLRLPRFSCLIWVCRKPPAALSLRSNCSIRLTRCWLWAVGSGSR